MAQFCANRSAKLVFCQNTLLLSCNSGHSYFNWKKECQSGPMQDKKTEPELEIGRTLQRLRQERQLTVTELAAQSKVSAPMISRIENGHVSPSLSTLHALADALSVSLMAMFSHTDTTSDVHHVQAGTGLPSRRITPDHTHD